MGGPGDIRGLRGGFNGKPGGQMVGDLVALHLRIVDIDQRGPLVLRDKGMASVSFEEEAGQKEVLAGRGPHVSGNVDHGDQVRVVIRKCDEVIEIRLNSIGHVAANGFVELLLYLGLVVLNRELPPIESVLTRQNKARGSLDAAGIVDCEIRNAVVSRSGI